MDLSADKPDLAAMVARIVRLDRSPERSGTAPARPGAGLPPGRGSEAWRGASGRCYRLGVYGLIACPPLPMAVYVLARRDRDGRCRALHVGVAGSDAPTLNLAQVRRQGAQAGAGEVHVYLDAACEGERSLVACDLRAGLLGTLTAAGFSES